MGIPFYFATLIKTHAGITEAVKKLTPMEVDVLGIDFNCLIHRYLLDEDPIQSVINALDVILTNVCRAKTVFIALDGLVPYAKIVQQRYRRMRTKEGTGTFDRNQISPDTPYMRELEKAVQTRFPFAVLSPTSEPGEGEHKLITMFQSLEEHRRRSICMYGLDADLILIALQHHRLSRPHSMWLLRESAEFNDPKLKTAEFSTLSIWKLLKQLPLPVDQYMALSILCFGNDFMPNLGMFSLREDGYDRALHIYREAGNPNLFTPEGRYRFIELSARKEFQVLKERTNLRKIPIEKGIVGKDSALISRKYGLHILDGVENMRPVVEAFWKTFHWTMWYFRKSVPPSWDWVYPYPDAPLLNDLLVNPDPGQSPQGELDYHIGNQLQFILPHDSLRTAKRRVLFRDEIYTESRHPWLKRHEWEAKPRISLPWSPNGDRTSVSLL